MKITGPAKESDGWHVAVERSGKIEERSFHEEETARTFIAIARFVGYAEYPVAVMARLAEVHTVVNYAIERAAEDDRTTAISVSGPHIPENPRYGKEFWIIRPVDPVGAPVQSSRTRVERSEREALMEAEQLAEELRVPIKRSAGSPV